MPEWEPVGTAGILDTQTAILLGGVATACNRCRGARVVSDVRQPFRPSGTLHVEGVPFSDWVWTSGPWRRPGVPRSL